MDFQHKRLIWVFVLAAVALIPKSARANAIVNGGFETGDFTGWTVTGGPCEFVLSSIGGQSICTGIDAGTDPGAHSGNDAAYLGQYGSLGTLSQTVATTAGATYDLEFWLASTSFGGLGGSSPNQFEVLWNGTPVFNQINVAVEGYQRSNLTLLATGTSGVLTFASQHNPAYFVVDSVSLEQVPEPATISLLATGFFGLGVFGWRGKSSLRTRSHQA
jgi:hypothetical protein